MANQIICNSEEAETYAAEVKKLAQKWQGVVDDINSANKILNEGVEANIQIAFNEVIAGNQKAFECLYELLTSLGTTVEEAVNDINAVDNEIANQIRRKYGIS
ncbi:MAG: hypothetical protein IJM19_05780 [Ruminococcus sp.]|nr:hypothetical protein [Ruminococcus sp.]MBR6386566.1 hypothetical protein [Ruminococcus sp.]